MGNAGVGLFELGLACVGIAEAGATLGLPKLTVGMAVIGLLVVGDTVDGLVGNFVVGAAALVGLAVEVPVVGSKLGVLGTKTGADKTGLVCVGPEVKDPPLEAAVVGTPVFGGNNVGIPVVEGVGI